MADVFVSYARSDKDRVAPLVAAIEDRGWSVWWDPAIAPGQEFDHQIAEELKKALAVIVVWTPRSVMSRWVRGEARAGADRGVLVPVRLDNAELPIDVRAFHTIDLDATSVARSPHLPDLLAGARRDDRATALGRRTAQDPPGWPRPDRDRTAFRSACCRSPT
jgi:hypothetical protein